MMKVRDWSALPQVGVQIGARFLIGPHVLAIYERYLKTNLRDSFLPLSYQSKKRGILEGILELHKVIFIKMHIIQIINNLII